MWRRGIERGTVRSVVRSCLWLLGPGLVVTVPPESARGVDGNAEFYPGHVLVAFKATTTAGARQDAHAAAGALQVLKDYQWQGLQLVQVPAGQEQTAAASYGNDPNVEYAHPDYRVHFLRNPNDPDFAANKLWGLYNIAQDLTWEMAPGCYYCPDSGLFDADIDATLAWDVWQGREDFRIAIIDTGVNYKHADLYTNIWINQEEIPPTIYAQLTDVDSDGFITFLDLNQAINRGPGKITDLNNNGYIDGEDVLKLVAQDGWADGVDNDGNGAVDDIVGYDFGADDPRPMDESGHGTQMAGIIAARGDNMGRCSLTTSTVCAVDADCPVKQTCAGTVGVNWRAKIVPLKLNFGPDDDAFVSAAISAIRYCSANGIRLSNNSWTIRGFESQGLYNAIAEARNAGHVFVTGAGNEGLNIDGRAYYPQTYDLDNIICVAATDNNDQWASSVHPFPEPSWASNFGAQSVDLGAPGVNIYTTFANGGYDFVNGGTSLAAAYVTGVVGLVWSRFDDWTMTQVRDRVLNTVRKVDSLRTTGPHPTVTGGVVNARLALSYDCNGNGIDDADDIAQGRSSDCMSNETNCCVARPSGWCDIQSIQDCVCDPNSPNYMPECCFPASDPRGTGWTYDCVDAAWYCGLRCNLYAGNGIPDECDPFGVQPAASDSSVVRLTRALSLTFPAPVAGGQPSGPTSILLTMVDLQHPDPRNVVGTTALPTQTVPQNFSTFDTDSNGVCSGATATPNYNGHPCRIQPPFVNDGCPAVGPAESGAQCSNFTDDDGDGKVNDGCPTVGLPESGTQCANSTDDDSANDWYVDCACNTPSCAFNDAAHNGTCIGNPAPPLVECTAAGERNSCARWVGKPATFLEAQEQPSWGNYRAARLQCTPFYYDWVTETAGKVCAGPLGPANSGLPCVDNSGCTAPATCIDKKITVVGAEILPSSTYDYPAFATGC